MKFNTPLTRTLRSSQYGCYGLVGLAALVSVLSLTSCSKKQDAAASKPPVNACTLVTHAEMEAIFGRPMKTPEEQSRQTTSICNYVSADDVNPMLSFTLLVSPVYKRSAAEAYTQYVADLKKELDVEITEVAGLGEKAGWSEDVKQLTIFKGRMMLVISGVPADRATLEVNRQIAGKALARWPK